MVGEVEEYGQVLGRRIRVTRVGQPRVRVSEFVEERMNHRLYRRQTLRWCVLQQSRDQVDSIRVSLPEDLCRISFGALLWNHDNWNIPC